MSLNVSNLTREYRINPLGIDVLQPRLSWQLESDQRGTCQISYRGCDRRHHSAPHHVHILPTTDRCRHDIWSC